MNRTRVKSKPFRPKQPLPRPKREFEAEGELTIEGCNGVPLLLIDDVSLSEIIAFHFRVRYDEDGVREFGKCKVLIIPMRE